MAALSVLFHNQRGEDMWPFKSRKILSPLEDAVKCQEGGDTCLACTATIEGEVLPAKSAKTRPPCPFYGFVGMAGMLMDNSGNACGIAGGHTPCKMEMHGEKPNWKTCGYYNNAENEAECAKTLSSVKVFPNELLPRHQGAWSGISFPEWYERVMPK